MKNAERNENTNGLASEARRLEALWSGDFGNNYIDRNASAGYSRGPFWHTVLAQFPLNNALEVGCNLGGNLRWLAETLRRPNIFGVDINHKALASLRSSLPGVNAVWSQALHLPFRDSSFDLVFTIGVLIHQPLGLLPSVMSEIVRCSRRFVLCGEYYAARPTEIVYRGQRGALFKQDFGTLYKRLFPKLELLRRGFLSRSEGWDDVTYWLFEKMQ